MLRSFKFRTRQFFGLNENTVCGMSTIGKIEYILCKKHLKQLMKTKAVDKVSGKLGHVGHSDLQLDVAPRVRGRSWEVGRPCLGCRRWR